MVVKRLNKFETGQKKWARLKIYLHLEMIKYIRNKEFFPEGNSEKKEIREK